MDNSKRRPESPTEEDEPTAKRPKNQNSKSSSTTVTVTLRCADNCVNSIPSMAVSPPSLPGVENVNMVETESARSFKCTALEACNAIFKSASALFAKASLSFITTVLQGAYGESWIDIALSLKLSSTRAEFNASLRDGDVWLIVVLLNAPKFRDDFVAALTKGEAGSATEIEQDEVRNHFLHVNTALGAVRCVLEHNGTVAMATLADSCRQMIKGVGLLYQGGAPPLEVMEEMRRYERNISTLAAATPGTQTQLFLLSTEVGHILVTRKFAHFLTVLQDALCSLDLSRSRESIREIKHAKQPLERLAKTNVYALQLKETVGEVVEARNRFAHSSLTVEIVLETLEKLSGAMDKLNGSATFQL